MKTSKRLLYLLLTASLLTLLAACHHNKTGPDGSNSVSGMYVPYSVSPDFKTDPFALGKGGEWGTGLGIADIDRNGFPDIVVSSGNDKANQHVTVYFNDGENNIDAKPDWVSADTDHHGTLAVGDIDGNGWPDVAVSIFLGPSLSYTGGGVKVYYNYGPPHYLNTKPEFIDRGYPSFGCALGDMDGDGDLDLAVAGGEPIPEVESFATQQCGGEAEQESDTDTSAQHDGEASGQASGETQLPPFTTPGRIYINEGGRFSATNVWKSNEQFVAMAVEFADVNYDGLMDVIFQSAPLRVYLGKPSANAGTGAPATIGNGEHWTSVDANYYGNGLDYAAGMQNPVSFDKPSFSIAASSNSYMGQGRGGFSLYRFLSPFVIQYKPYTSLPAWQSKYGGWGSAVRLGDPDNDGNLDMFTHRWNTPGMNDLNGHLLIYKGNGGMFSETPVWQSEATSIIEAIQLADLDTKDVKPDSYTMTVDSSAWAEGQKGLSVMYLPYQNIHSIDSVYVNGTKLAQSMYTTIPGRNWISFAYPVPDKTIVTAHYTRSMSLDVVYTNWNCDLGNYVYFYK